MRNYLLAYKTCDLLLMNNNFYAIVTKQLIIIIKFLHVVVYL